MKNIIFPIKTVIFILFFCLFSKVKAQHTEVGVASYYAYKFHGKPTASGEKYNMNDFTAAHPTLPFNTLVKVTNLKTHQTVIVRINDRGPHTKKRIIDLSKAAAKKIGLLKAGIAKVKIEVIKKETASDPKPASSDNLSSKQDIKELKEGYIYNQKRQIVDMKGYIIQTSSFSDLDYALEALDTHNKKQISEFYLEVSKIKSKMVFRILTGPYAEKVLAEAELKKIKKAGYKGFIRKI